MIFNRNSNISEFKHLWERNLGSQNNLLLNLSNCILKSVILKSEIIMKYDYTFGDRFSPKASCKTTRKYF